MPQQLLTPSEDAELERPSVSHSTRFGWDQRIRNVKGYGRPQKYEIKHRPNRGEPVWEREDGKTFTHTEVLKAEGLKP